MSRFKKLLLSSAVAGLLIVSQARAQVAIITGSFYTSDLKNQLVASGLSVTEITSYTAASLAGYQAVIHYGNSFTDVGALSSYVNAGGTLVLTPWAGLNFAVPANLQVFANGGSPVFTAPYPGVSILAPADPLLNAVTFPVGPGGFNVGYIGGIGFAPGATQIANWSNGTAFLGTRSFGAGEVVGINMHVITSDTAFNVIDQAWATQLLVNAVGAGAPLGAVPEPSTYGLIGAAALVGAVLARRVKAKAKQI